MSGFPTNPQASRVVLIWNGYRVELSEIVGFAARQVIETLPLHPLNDDPMSLYIPKGWAGRIEVDRFDSAVDRLFYQIEAAFRTSGGPPWIAPQSTFTAGIDPDTGQPITSTRGGGPPGTIFHYVREQDGSETTIEYGRVSATLSDAGTYVVGRPVRQVIDFAASYRNLT